MNIDVTNRGEQRKFGIVMAAAFAVLGLIRWGFAYWFHPEDAGGYPYIFLIIGAPFLVLGLVAPGLLRWPLHYWMQFALAVNWLMTRVLLTMAFLFIITPGRLILSALRKDLLKRSIEPDAETYWEEPEAQPEEFDRYLNQF